MFNLMTTETDLEYKLKGGTHSNHLEYGNVKNNNLLCIFGFTFHKWFCLCDLVNITPSDKMLLICDKCSGKFKNQYECFLTHPENSDWKGEFEDYLSILMEEKMIHIRTMPLHEYECNLTKKELEQVEQKFGQIYNNFMKDLM